MTRFTSLLKRLQKLKKYRPAKTLFPAGHFYSPYPDLEDIERRKEEIFGREKRQLPGIDLREEAQLELLKDMSACYDLFPYPQIEPESRFTLENGAYSYCDAVILFCMLNLYRPQRVIEIGSGYSSALMLDTNERFLNNRMDLTFIEPYPELLLELARPSDSAHYTLLAEPLHSVGSEVFAALESGDLLFIDSTHIAKPGSDVNQIFFEILPALRRGTLIHIHDVFYPFEYPIEWVRETRAWNEDYLLRAFLQDNHDYEILVFNHFLGLHQQDQLRRLLPLASRKTGGALWLRKLGESE